jgi:acyl carrier protein phosphodiesterase
MEDVRVVHRHHLIDKANDTLPALMQAKSRFTKE